MKIACYTDSDADRFPDEGTEEPIQYPDRSYKYAADVETSKNVYASIDVKGLCRLWNNWRDDSQLVWMLHGFLMLAPYGSKAWHEVDFLVDLLNVERGTYKPEHSGANK